MEQRDPPPNAVHILQIHGTNDRIIDFQVAIHANILMAEVADVPTHCDQFDVGLTITAALSQERQGRELRDFKSKSPRA